MAVSYIELTRSKFPNHPPYKWHESTDVPFTKLSKPLAQTKVALFSSGGISHKSQLAFNPEKNDFTYRIIDKMTAPDELCIYHDNYNHKGAESDINCVFPYERLRELEKNNEIKEFSQRTLTFMGRIFSKTKLIEEMAPAFINELRADQVDVALLVPA
jgi:D-proline reductase (dithiol) PrdB